jgi:hypothetical protein
MGFELRALHLLGRHSKIPLDPYSQFYFALVTFSDKVSCFLPEGLASNHGPPDLHLLSC